MSAVTDESVAAVLLLQDAIWSRTTPVTGKRRAPYCMMGVCFDCLATINGAPSIQTCMTQLQDGMVIERQYGRPDVSL